MFLWPKTTHSRLLSFESNVRVFSLECKCAEIRLSIFPCFSLLSIHLFVSVSRKFERSFWHIPMKPFHMFIVLIVFITWQRKNNSCLTRNKNCLVFWKFPSIFGSMLATHALDYGQWRKVFSIDIKRDN